MRVALILTVLLTVLLTAAVARADVASNHVRIDLIADTAVVEPGRPFTVGIRFRIDPGWHIYWTDPGDSGSPTRVTVKTSSGIAAGPVAFPAPSVLRFPGDIVNYGYENEVVLLVPVTASDHGDINVDVDYLVCKDVCLPGKGGTALRVPMGFRLRPSDVDPATVRRWAARLPRAGDPRIAGLTKWYAADPADRARFTQTTTVRWASVPSDVDWIHPGSVAGWDVDAPHVSTAGNVTTIVCAARKLNPAAGPLPSLLVYRGPDGGMVGDDLNRWSPPATRPAAARGE